MIVAALIVTHTDLGGTVSGVRDNLQPERPTGSLTHQPPAPFDLCQKNADRRDCVSRIDAGG